MNKAVRKAVIAGNWKMNKTPAEATELLNAITPLVKDAGCDVVVCVPYVDIAAALEATEGTNVEVGAENCHWAECGAFTGEISAEMLKAMGVEYVIIGHSERRTYFGETDVTVNRARRAALDAGLTVIVCVGEYLEQREQGITDELVAMQTKIALRRRDRGRAGAHHHRLRAGLGHRHRQDRDRGAGQRGLRRDPRDDRRTCTAKRLPTASPFSTAAP